MLKREINIIKQKSGMTLVEVLTAMTILTLVIFCFSPLFLSYYNSIVIAGNEMKDVYEDSGYLQKVISSRKDDIDEYAKHYSGNFDHVMTVKSPTSGTEVSINASGKFLGGAIDEDSTLRPFETGYVTAVSNYESNRILCFPTTITDDFKEKFITVVYDGGRFDSGNFSSDGPYKLYVTQNGTRKRLTSGQEYTIARYEGQDDMLLITLRGGSDICFENSPLVFDYNNGEAVKEIEIDAPTAIMVGEKASDDNYYYYVTRGHVDKDGKLEIIQKSMTGAPLTSAMNDVSWVSADSGDGKNTDSAGNKYGYYVMCGDEGQIRRFWRNETTGNYYWGGDGTYDTTIKINRVDPKNTQFSFNSTYNIGTTANYKYSFQARTRADTDSNGSPHDYPNGYNLSTDKSNYLQSANICTVNASDDMYFYASDGKVVSYQIYKRDGWVYLPFTAFTNIYGNGDKTGDSKYNDIRIRRQIKTYNKLEDYAWIKPKNKTYSQGYQYLNEVSSDYNPITLTSVDAIVIADKTGAGYLSGIKTAGNHYYSGEWTDIDYPSANYTLYCGYIPAAMDIWETKTGYNQYFGGNGNDKDGAMVMCRMNNDSGHPGVLLSILSKFTRLDGNVATSGTERYAYWRGNFGLSPYLVSGTKSGSELFKPSKDLVIDNATIANIVFWADPSGWDYNKEAMLFYPYDNMSYAITGKFYDSNTTVSSDHIKKNNALIQPQDLMYSTLYGKQQYITNGDVVDITAAYLSHPFAVHISANPTDDVVYDMSNDKGNKIFYFNNSRETVTYLDCASTVIPSGAKDIHISLMVGYVQGGLVEYSGNDLYANTLMNNGIVMLRAGTAGVGTQQSANSKTEEYYAKDATGYKLDAESNVFHQFYYLNSITPSSKTPIRTSSEDTHIGDIYGANYWENNRHIDYASINGGAPDDPSKTNTGNYNYLRCHPIANTKINCVEWGVTWDDNPEAMWGTENGTLLSWDVDIDKVKDSNESSEKWNDRSVDAEFQSYKWILNVSGVGAEKGKLGEAKTFAVHGKTTSGTNYKETVGAHWGKKNQYTAQKFVLGNSISEVYMGFYDKWTRLSGIWKEAGFISVLESINDIEYSDDIWVAAGDQSGQDPATFCPPGKTDYGNAKVTVKPYIDKDGDGKGGSWINVRMWYDVKGTGKYAEYNTDGSIKESNTEYYWSAVQISENPNYNIEQINCINGIWMATGYVDENNNDEYDDGEKTVICWTRDPSKPCGTPGGWSEHVAVWKYQGGSDPWHEMTAAEIGGINSVAARD